MFLKLRERYRCKHEEKAYGQEHFPLQMAIKLDQAVVFRHLINDLIFVPGIMPEYRKDAKDAKRDWEHYPGPG